uniref:NADH-ubiquinone oxidoreductase chain 3 n=1 Tax=Prionospio sp. 1 MH-2023 TaxID=3058460 RepID=A0AAU6QFV7_9ANNE
MFASLITSMIAITLAFLVMALAYTLSARSFKDREKSSPFECGFDPKDKARLPFSTRFFLLAVIFLVFDIEIVLLMPSPFIFASAPTYLFLYTMAAFLIVLLLGTLHEWREGSLSWSN